MISKRLLMTLMVAALSILGSVGEAKNGQQEKSMGECVRVRESFRQAAGNPCCDEVWTTDRTGRSTSRHVIGTYQSTEFGYRCVATPSRSSNSYNYDESIGRSAN